jgi:hypothetical protein
MMELSFPGFNHVLWRNHDNTTNTYACKHGWHLQRLAGAQFRSGAGAPHESVYGP